ncbi:mannose-P-dolichol utilization defect 1 protein [Copidosoma floridanum]|uniref:mannose-P-dolichol utilization defect 1 protein n=1 Tax=Copidosoma floridanum TaxID=29053 RepID=UPI0006C995F1|nr:mannose-P-dolichol utilization defect 1 protein [Copidosoma floridanum]
MASVLQDLKHLLFTKACLKEYTENFNFLHAECFKITLSKALGLAIIAGSFMVKIPQIMKILKSGSAKGINIISVLLELLAISSMASYSYISQFPFSSWGDAIFLGLQTVTIAFLVVYYSNGMTKATAFLSAYTAVVAAIVSGYVPLTVLWFAQAMNIPVIVTSRLIQAYTNYSNGSTGQLSAVTAFLLLFGAVARIFTSIQETGDAIMIAMFTVSTLMNGIIVAQLLYYWNAAEKKVKISKKKK